ncbi:MAG: HAMP domain-containing histidine kinase [Candidatus Nomurabacteria bacterium]|nr:HAMP domain-containing histidine kinase [Candidatus Nomurabacteria bacterium]
MNEIEQLRLDLDKCNSESQEKSEFLSMITHQLRTPLSGIKWTFKMILDGDIGSFSEEQKQIINKGFDASERMVELLEEVITANQNDQWDFTYNFSPVDISKVIDGIIMEFYEVARTHNVSIGYKPPEQSIGLVEADGEKIAIVMQNLLENSIKYNIDEGEVSVSLSQIDGYARIQISDTGIGIPEGQISNVFTKFFRADNAKEIKKQGTGLGLFTAKKIIERHGGTISIESTLGKGTRFTILLPLKQPQNTV